MVSTRTVTPACLPKTSACRFSSSSDAGTKWLDRCVGLGRPAARMREFRLFGEHRELRILRPDRVVSEMPERRMVEGVGGDDPGVEVLLLEEELDEILGERDVLRELPDADRSDRRRRVGAGWPSRAVVVVDLVGNRHALGEREVVRADRVVDQIGRASWREG